MTKEPYIKVKRIHRDRYDVMVDGEYSWYFVERVAGKWYVSHEETGRGEEAFARFKDVKELAVALADIEDEKMAEAAYQRQQAVGADDDYDGVIPPGSLSHLFGRPPQPLAEAPPVDDELMFELRANFEPGTTVVNVLTGQRYKV